MRDLAIKFSWIFIIILIMLVSESQSVSATRKISKYQKPCKQFVLYCHDNLLLDPDDVANSTSAKVTTGTKLGKLRIWDGCCCFR